jgi:hypothetical protein
MTTDPDNLTPAVEHWLSERGWKPEARNAAGVLWFHGGTSVLVPDQILAGGPAPLRIAQRLAAKTGETSQQVLAAISRASCAQYALDAWHDFQLWIAMLPDDLAVERVDEATRYLYDWVATHPAPAPPEPEGEAW